MFMTIGREVKRIAGLVCLALTAAAAAQQFEITRSTIDGGGVMRSTGGNFELSGTIGQPDAGTMTGGAFELNGGFWFPLDLGDCQEDGDVDLLDHDLFESCLTGPGGVAPVGSCRCFDVNASGHVDLIDFAEIQAAFTN
jgi:hypothetical protein